MLVKLFRTAFTLVGGLAGYGVFLLTLFLLRISGTIEKSDLTLIQKVLIGAGFVIVFALIFFKLTPTLNRQSKKMTKNIETDLQNVSSKDILVGTAGLIAGLIIAFLVSNVYNLINIPYLPMALTILTYLIMGYLGVVVATKKAAEIFFMLNSNIKTSERAAGRGKQKGSEGIPKIIDTSVIIDGRISDIMRTGFLEGPIVIPEFVLVELRHIADSSDGLKRTRGRRGLDILNKIQKDYGIEIYNTTGEKALEEIPEVDVKLLKLAQMMNGKVVTNDFNLNKVATIKGVDVLNINELANTLKPVVLPGEEMNIFLVKEGKESNQAVAYLDDGTMIVVEDGKKYIGKSVDLTVTSVLQTAAGRMIFGKVDKSNKRG